MLNAINIGQLKEVAHVLVCLSSQFFASPVVPTDGTSLTPTVLWTHSSFLGAIQNVRRFCKNIIV
jgi:hypothetical protein